MSSPGTGSLPQLSVGDFSPGCDHLAEAYQGGRVFAIVHKSDPIRPLLATLANSPSDPNVYVFIHGGQEVSRFENMQVGTHENPESVLARLLANHYGSQLDGMQVRLCTCYGNMLRPGDVRTLAQRLASLLPRTSLEAYHALVHVDPRSTPPRIILGDSLAWDPISGPYYVGPPGNWEPVVP